MDFPSAQPRVLASHLLPVLQSGSAGRRCFNGCRNTAWSPMRSAQSLSKFFVITGFATTTAWFSHPYLLNLAAHVLHLDFKVRPLLGGLCSQEVSCYRRERARWSTD